MGIKKIFALMLCVALIVTTFGTSMAFADPGNGNGNGQGNGDKNYSAGTDENPIYNSADHQIKLFTKGCEIPDGIAPFVLYRGTERIGEFSGRGNSGFDGNGTAERLNEAKNLTIVSNGVSYPITLDHHSDKNGNNNNDPSGTDTWDITSIVFPEQETTTGSLKVIKQVTGIESDTEVSNNFTFSVKYKDEVIDTFTLKSGEYKILDELEVGEYEVIESLEGREVVGHTFAGVTGEDEYTVSAGNTTTATITNTYTAITGGGGDNTETPDPATGTVKVKKSVTGTVPESEKNAQYIVALFSDADLTVELERQYVKADEEVTFKKALTLGDEYYLAELDAEGNVIDGAHTGAYQPQFNGQGFTWTVKTTEAKPNEEVSLVNQYKDNTEETNKNLGSITVEKFVTGTNAPAGKKFHVTLFKDKDLKDKVKTLAVEAGEKVTFEELHPGSYYLAETDDKGEPVTPNPDDYQPFFGEQNVSTNNYHVSVAAKQDTYVKLLNQYKDKTEGGNEGGTGGGETPKPDPKPEQPPKEPIIPIIPPVEPPVVEPTPEPPVEVLPPDEGIIEPEKPAKPEKPVKPSPLPKDEGIVDEPANPDQPQTGDMQNLAGWMSLMLAALAALGVTVHAKRKED